MTQSSILDLSEVRPVKVEKKLATLDQVRECLALYKETMVEAVEARATQLRALMNASQSKIQALPNTVDPRQEIVMRLKFLDSSVVRLTDLIYASIIVLDHEKNPALLDMFPKFKAQYQDVIEAIVANRDKTIQQTTHEEQLLVSSYRDLAKFRDTLKAIDAVM